MKLLHRGKKIEVWLHRGPYFHDEVAIRHKEDDGWHWYGEGVVPLERTGEALDKKRAAALKAKK